MIDASYLNILQGKKHLHFIGIGGSGMYPLVQILHARGFYITGSDNNEGDTLDAERKMGIPITIGHDAKNLGDADLVVYTAAARTTRNWSMPKSMGFRWLNAQPCWGLSPATMKTPSACAEPMGRQRQLPCLHRF